MAGNYQSKVFFEQKDSEEKGETTVLQDRTHPSQKKFFALLGTQICMPLSYYHCNVGLEVRPICDVGPESRPISFLYPILIVPHLILTPWSFSPSVRRSVPLQEGPRGVQHRARGLRQRPAPLRRDQGEQIAQRVLPVRPRGASHRPGPRRPQIHQRRP